MIEYKCADFDNFSQCCPHYCYDSEGTIECICKHPEPSDEDGEEDSEGNWIVKCVDWNCPFCLSVDQEDEGRDDVD